MTNENWQTLRRDYLYRAKTPDEVSFVRDKVRTSSGYEADYLHVESPYEVVVVVGERDDGHVALIRQYRYLAAAHLLEVPSGSPAPGLDLAGGALAELREESGAIADHVEHLGEFFSGIGFTNQRMHVFWARVVNVVPPTPSPTESIRTEWVHRAHVPGLITNGAVASAPSALALMLCATKKWA